MDGHLPLSALLSFVLVAFTIEFDNELEHQLPHRTTNHGFTGGDLFPGPWLVSLAMWSNCLQFLDEEGKTERELGGMAGTTTNLDGMYRWGYVTIKPPAANMKAPRSKWLLRLTARGRKAQQVCKPLFSVIEKRWESRFGKTSIDELRATLALVVDQIPQELPDCMPILGYGLFSNNLIPRVRRDTDSSSPTLAALLSKILLQFAIEFERESTVSLAICANVLRLVGKGGIRVRDLPRLSGISKQLTATALSYLTKREIADLEVDSQAKSVKLLQLRDRGETARDSYMPLAVAIEKRWSGAFGERNVQHLRSALETVGGDGTAAGSPLFQGLDPYPEGWRASMPKPETLPHYPMVSHRGGFPDGS